jgi:hypothetical protein
MIDGGTQNIVNHVFSFNLPIFGAVSLQINYIKSIKVELADDLIFYNLEAGIEIRPKSGLLPNVFGTVCLGSSLRPHIEDLFKVEFKILNFEWLEGPNSSKGKPLKLIKRLSSQMLESSEVIASIIEKKLSERLTSEELEKWIASLIPTLMIARVP